MSHQTVRIRRGRHESPEHGACVMELSSMLADEPFNDRPRCVDPVLAGYMRALNDRLGHRTRQRLLPYAALAVDTRGPRRLTRRRRERCLAFAGVHLPASPLVRAVVHAVTRVRIAVLIGLRAALSLDEGAGEWAAREAIVRDDVDAALAFIDELIACGGAPPPLLPAEPPVPEPARAG